MKLSEMNPNPVIATDFSVEKLEEISALFDKASMVINNIECEFFLLKDQGKLAEKLLVPLPEEYTIWMQLVMLKRMFANAAKVKKAVALMLMIILYCNAFSQGYLSTAIINKGIEVRLGYLGDKIGVSAGVQMPITQVEAPTVFSLAIERAFYFSPEENGYCVTTSFGVAGLKRREFVPAGKYVEEYDKVFEYDTYQKVTDIKPYYALEIGKDAHLGRFFIKGVYTGDIFFGVGMSLFFNK